jgi:hypothetical protein
MIAQRVGGAPAPGEDEEAPAVMSTSPTLDAAQAQYLSDVSGLADVVEAICRHEVRGLFAKDLRDKCLVVCGRACSGACSMHVAAVEALFTPMSTSKSVCVFCARVVVRRRVSSRSPRQYLEDQRRALLLYLEKDETLAEWADEILRTIG